MGFLWGFIMFFICHTVANIFANNLYCYIKEEKAEDVNRYAMKQYLTKTIISCVVYIAIFIVVLTVEAFSEYTAAILIGNGIGFITAFIHFRLIADDNYIKQKAKNEWNSWNYMSFEEKREALKKQQEVNTENIYSQTPTAYQTRKSLHRIDDDDYDETFDKNKSYDEIITEYFKKEKKLNTNIEFAPNGDKIITINYQINYLWTICIKIDEDNEMIKIYTPFFTVAPSKRNYIYELLSEWNREVLFVKFSFENTSFGSFVIAEMDIPLTTKDSIGEFAFNIVDEFVITIDDQFDRIPKNLIELWGGNLNAKFDNY